LTGTADSVLNIVMPAILILIVVGFIWMKFFNVYAMPMLHRMWEKLTDDDEDKGSKKEITYE